MPEYDSPIDLTYHTDGNALGSGFLGDAFDLSTIFEPAEFDPAGTITQNPTMNAPVPASNRSIADTAEDMSNHVAPWSALGTLWFSFVNPTDRAQPTRKSLGKIEGAADEPFVIFNSFSTSVDVTSRTLVGLSDGVSDDLSLPLTLPPKGSAAGTLSVGGSGSRLVASTIQFPTTSPDPGGGVEFAITGLRVIDFWYPPTWDEGKTPQLRRSFKTDVHVADNRKQKRQTTAQSGESEFSFRATFHAQGSPGVKALMNLLYDIRGDAVSFPFFPEGFQASTNRAGQTTVTADRALSTMVRPGIAGEKILRVDRSQPNTRWEIRLITSIFGSQVTTARYPAGSGNPDSWTIDIVPGDQMFFFMVTGVLLTAKSTHHAADEEEIETEWRA